MKHLTTTSQKNLSAIGLLICLTAPLHATNNAQSLHRYTWAIYNMLENNTTTAGKLFTELRAKNPSPYVLMGYSLYLFRKEAFSELITLAPQLEPYFTNDIEFQLMLAKAFDGAGKHEDSAKRILKLNQEHPEHPEITLLAAQIYTVLNKFDTALTTIDTYLNKALHKHPNNFIFHYLKAQIYSKLNKPQKALESIKTSLDIYPQFDRGWLFYAFLQDQAGHLNEAIQGYTSFLELSGTENKEVEELLLRLVLKQKLTERNTTTANVNRTCFDKAMAEFNNKDYKNALEHIDNCLKENPSDNDSKVLKIQILNSMQNYDQVIKTLKPWMLADAENPLWYQTLHLLCRTGLPYAKGAKLVHDVLRHNPDNLTALLYAADLHTRADNIPAALAAHKKALAHTQDPALKTKILFHQGLIYYQQNRLQEMVASLQEGYALDTSYAPLLNLLAYHYATQGNHEQAQPLIEVALAQQPNNLHFQDTQAMIWSAQKDYERARTLLEKLHAQAPDDTAIAEHVTHIRNQLSTGVQQPS